MKKCVLISPIYIILNSYERASYIILKSYERASYNFPGRSA